MDVSDFDYPLPEAAIAQTPVEPRDSARLLVDGGPDGAPQHRRVADLPELLGPGDLLVVNDTRVRPARLHLVKTSGGAVEVLLLDRRPDGTWEALVKPSRRVAPGTVLHTPDGQPAVTVGEDLGGRRLVTLVDAPVEPSIGGLVGAPAGGPDDVDAPVDPSDGDNEPALLATYGEVPLPPYIHEPLADPERYQTVFARRTGSVAAPTAGLHLTDDVLDRCRERGVRIERVELQVGLGTFRPIATDVVEHHHMHAERYRVPPEVMVAAAEATRVVAVGTTVVRSLESAAATGRCEGSTELFIRGDHDWRVVDLLLTNFHVPRSSLLVLVDAFVGPRWRRLYEEALAEGYRFLSFGDAMLLTRSRRTARPAGGEG
jgi:S-adenosylmethionine:tRNA ribosyltransferase-isomerase